MEEHEKGRDAFDNEDAYKLHCLRHSTAHVMAQAVKRLWPQASLAIGPSIEDGFYYDIELDNPLAEAELASIEAEMKKIVKENQPFEREEWEAGKARAWFLERGQQFKVELIDGFGDPKVGIYKNPQKGDGPEFLDLCRGPHVRFTGQCKHFKLLRVSGAYWRGDATRPQLQRVYGTVWPTKEELDQYLFRIEEAKKRDHRRLGPQLGLFMMHEYAPGAAFWLERGEHIYNKLSQMMRRVLLNDGYIAVRTPMLFDKKLWETSGHWEHYQENMFHFAEGQHKEGESDEEHDSHIMALKAMNCPSHMLIFKSRGHSYRDLPVRIHDQGVLHRNEASGSLSGLTRVRQFCQDDAHLFCMTEQIEDEVKRLLDLVDRFYGVFGMEYAYKLSTRPEKYMGELAQWNTAEDALRRVLDERAKPYWVDEGDGAFYGPKIDFELIDALGRKHQCATIQIDFQMPLRFGLTYTGADNLPHTPVVIHRAIFGSFERFIGILTEHFAGQFPVWLAPEAVRVMTISEKAIPGGRRAYEALRAAGIQVTFDDSDSKVGYKIKQAHDMRVPYMAIVGERDQENGTVSVRWRDGDLGAIPLDQFVARMIDETREPV